MSKNLYLTLHQIFYSLLIFSILFMMSFHSNATEENLTFKPDNEKHIKEKNIFLLSGKNKSLRVYSGSIMREYSVSPEELIKAIISFEDRCDNKLKEKRFLTKIDFVCKFHNDNLVESKITPLKNKSLNPPLIDQFLVFRNIYNRNAFQHVDLVSIESFPKKIINEIPLKVLAPKMWTDNLKLTHRIFMEKIDEKTILKLSGQNYKSESAFNMINGEFLIFEIAPNRLQLIYTYYADTDHWLLNKSISINTVLDSISSSLELLFDNLQKQIKDK